MLSTTSRTSFFFVYFTLSLPSGLYRGFVILTVFTYVFMFYFLFFSFCSIFYLVTPHFLALISPMNLFLFLLFYLLHFLLFFSLLYSYISLRFQFYILLPFCFCQCRAKNWLKINLFVLCVTLFLRCINWYF